MKRIDGLFPSPFLHLAKYETLHWYFGVFFSLGYHVIEEGSLFDHDGLRHLGQERKLKV